MSPHLFPSLEAALEAGWARANRDNAELHLLHHDGSVRFHSSLLGGEVDVTEATRNDEGRREDFDEADGAIMRARARIDAQEQRVTQLKKNGNDSQTAELILAGMRDRLEKLHILSEIVMQAIAYRKKRANLGRLEEYLKVHADKS